MLTMKIIFLLNKNRKWWQYKQHWQREKPRLCLWSVTFQQLGKVTKQACFIVYYLSITIIWYLLLFIVVLHFWQDQKKWRLSISCICKTLKTLSQFKLLYKLWFNSYAPLVMYIQPDDILSCETWKSFSILSRFKFPNVIIVVSLTCHKYLLNALNHFIVFF